MSEWLYGYKLITKDKRGSIYITFYEMGHTECPKNKVVHRPDNCGPLAVFKTLKSAQLFKGNYCKHLIIVPCKYKKSKDTEFWQYEKHAPQGMNNFDSYPEGTDFADKVICLE